MELVAILDTETTGLDHENDHCIEVAVVTYHLIHACVVDTMSLLIQAPVHKLEHVHRIPEGVMKYAVGKKEAWDQVSCFTHQCEAILAHNADFDKGWAPEYLHKIPWIDTCNGIVWPRQGSHSNLVTLCLDHGVGVTDSHRALSDCLMLARLLTRCAELGHDLNVLLAPGLRPMELFQALVSYDDRNKAKEAKFHWEPETKRWLRKMAEEDTAKLPFKVRKG
jgi:DNA polymerase-3 subunit epsilon